MELTKEYFDQQFKGLNARLGNMVTTEHFENRLSIMATKQDVETSIQRAIEKAINDLAVNILQPSFEHLERKLDKALARIDVIEQRPFRA